MEMRGRKSKHHEEGSEAFEKQKKNREYYMKFKSKHPGYYKKIKNTNVETIIEEDIKTDKNDIITNLKSIIQQLNKLISSFKNI